MADLAAHGGWPGILGTLTRGEDLDRAAARDALLVVLAGDATPAQIAGLIVALRMKGETVEELVGMVEAMLDAAAPLELPEGAIDIVGMGGGTSRREAALNVSTMAAVVAAAAGATVCKHGNRRASSTSGSFDLLDELGINVELDGTAVARCVDELGLGFCFARTFHPAMRFAGPIRADLGVPTVFNVLGPLSHPGRVTRQVLGVADPGLVDKVAEVLAARGTQHAWVVHGDDGLDELTTTTTTSVRIVRDGSIDATTIDSVSLGIAAATPDQLIGGDPAANVRVAREVLAGQPGPYRDIVVLNAAAGLVVAEVVEHLPDGLQVAGAAIDDGRAEVLVRNLVSLSGSLAPKP